MDWALSSISFKTGRQLEIMLAELRELAMQRVTEPEVMDSSQEAIEYDSMDFLEVNTAFAERAIALGPPQGLILDAGTGTARIPILMCQQRPQWQIIGIDLAQSMLEIGQKNVEHAGLQQQIKLELVDAKQMPYPDEHFDMVVSNSIVHHLPDPLPFLLELKRVLKPNGAILLRDLMRPDSLETLQAIVDREAGDCNAHQKQLFRDSLHAAFTLDEVNELLQQAGLEGVNVYQSSDRHWTAERETSQNPYGGASYAGNEFPRPAPSKVKSQKASEDDIVLAKDG
jgi:ubiquinone/menaquinone biosynthesis C-methylase UbiE